MIYCLSFHAPYRCRHSGACCTSGWPIPVEPPLRQRLDEALASRRLELPGGDASPFVDGAEMPDGSPVLRTSAAGCCACYDAERRRCAIHSQLGHAALPVSCQHFPRVCLVDDAATFVTLSHYCPTAAALLFSDVRPGIVGAPPDFAPMALEGLDARGALPPLLHPRMLMDRETYRRWERYLVALLGEAGPAEEGLLRVVAMTEAFRQWEPRRGPIGAALDDALDARPTRTPTNPRLTETALSFDRVIRASVPEDLRRDAPACNDSFTDLVAPSWESLAAPVRRYLAAHAFANWAAYQGRGVRTVTASLVAVLSVLRVEAARHCADAGRPLDAGLLAEAFRSTDLLTVHLASREELARRLGALEEGSAEELIEAI